jgi:hypothetical protein
MWQNLGGGKRFLKIFQSLHYYKLFPLIFPNHIEIGINHFPFIFANICQKYFN